MLRFGPQSRAPLLACTHVIRQHLRLQGDPHRMEIDGNTESPAPTSGASNGSADGGGPDLEQLARQISSLSQALQGKPHSAWSLGGFTTGVLLTCAVVWFLWYRFRYSIQRFSDRHRQREAVRQLSSMDANELTKLLGGVNLPSWVTYPDYERVQWLNTVVRQVWPFAAKYVTGWAEQELPPLLEANKPAWMRSIKLHHFSLGPEPPEPLGVKVYSEQESRSDEAIVEFDFVWNSEAHISFVVKPVPKAATHAATRLPVISQVVDAVSNLVIIKTAVENLTVNGRLRLTLRPLMSKLPLIGSAQVAFTEAPKFAFDLTVYGGDVSVLPGLETWLHGLIKDAVLAPFVLPEKIVIPLVDYAAPDFERPRALLQVNVLEAEHVPRMDVFSKSDPFVELYVRDKNKVKTQVLENTHSPHWDESFSLLVHYPETQSLTIKLLDWDAYDRDDEIGRCELKVRDLPRDRELDEWVDIEPPHQETPASQKYKTSGNPLGLAMQAGQKVVGFLIRPWDTAKVISGGLTRKGPRRQCRVHIKAKVIEFKEEEVQAALEEQRNPGKAGAALAHASPAVRKALQGGVLCLRVLRVEGLVGKPVLLGGWRRSVQVRVWFAGQQKQTRSVKGKAEQVNVDQELEFVVSGDAATQPHQMEVEVYDTHWRTAFQGRASVPFRGIRDAKLWRATLDLREVTQGRVSLEAQWMPAFAS